MVVILKEHRRCDHYFIVGDIGGTHFHVAICGCRQTGEYTPPEIEIIWQVSYLTNKVNEVSTLLAEVGQGAEKNGLGLSGCCLAVAGPVSNNYCQMTNASLIFDGYALANQLHMPVNIINDFNGLSFGLPLLDLKSKQVVALNESFSSDSNKDLQKKYLAVGAGTGLGVGFLVRNNKGNVEVFSSEGAHGHYAPYDELTVQIKNYIQNELYQGAPVEIESIVSGVGFINVIQFFKSQYPQDPFLQTFTKENQHDWAKKITMNTDQAIPKQIMHIFVKSYAQATASFTLAFLPNQGVFLGGGIARKNIEFFKKDNFFINEFIKQHNPMYGNILKKTNVYVIMDDWVALQGCAYAAMSFRKNT